MFRDFIVPFVAKGTLRCKPRSLFGTLFVILVMATTSRAFIVPQPSFFTVRLPLSRANVPPKFSVSSWHRSVQSKLDTAAAADLDTESSQIAGDENERPKTRAAKLRKLLFRSLPYLIAFFSGMRIGGFVFIPERYVPHGNNAVTRRMAKFPVASLALGFFVVREIWNSVPVWAKPKRFRGRSSAAATDEAEDPDDMTSWSALSRRLQGLFSSVNAKLANPLAPVKIRASLWALLQLSAQLEKKRVSQRDDLYEESGPAADISDMAGMDEALEFADWAYDESPDGSLSENLERLNFKLLRHDKTTIPGYVGHYVAISPERKLAVIGVKGTSNFEDLLTDCCGQSVSHQLDGPFVKDGSDEIRCHEGILISAKRLADDIQPFVEELLIPSGYKILICGHSLGAAASALLAVILRSRIPSLLSDDGSVLKVLAFASPPILDCDNALACKSFTTTIVNNADFVPRASMSNLVVLMEVLKGMNAKLEEKKISPEDRASYIALVKKLAEGTNGEMLMTAEELRKIFDSAYEAVELRDPEHLYVPGNVILMYDTWTGKNDTDAAQDGNSLSQTSANRMRLTDGIAKTLRTIALDDRMISDHMAVDYRSSIKSLLDRESAPVETSILAN